MTGHVWVSTAKTHADLIVEAYTDIFSRDQARAMEAEKRNDLGESVAEDMCPSRVWLEDPDLLEVPDLFQAQGQWIVSARVAAILARFDLGYGALHRIADGVFRSDNTTPLPGDYFAWIFGNAKRAFLEAQSPTARPMGGGGRDWCKFPATMADGAIAVSSAAVAGPSVWVDPLLFKSIFVSGELGDELNAARLRNALRLYTCRLI
jgi:hypothetical protein